VAEQGRQHEKGSERGEFRTTASTPYSARTLGVDEDEAGGAREGSEAAGHGSEHFGDHPDDNRQGNEDHPGIKTPDQRHRDHREGNKGSDRKSPALRYVSHIDE
jgi:hypothetical protein